MSKKDIEFKVIGTNEQLAEKLENIAASIKKGTLYIEQGTQAVTLNPAEDITMELDAKTRDDKQKLSIKLSWRTIPKAVEGDSALKILSNQPEPDIEHESTEMESEEEETKKPVKKKTTGTKKATE